MSSEALGQSISKVEITHISGHGVWLLARGRELFMPYEQFPWFKKATVEDILAVEEVSCDHFHWPKLDVDLTTAIIEHPERFPLTAR